MMRAARILSLLRVGLALAGFVAAVAAVALDDRQVGWGAIALLLGSLIVRLLQRGRNNSV
jgi:hypothetical protein